MNNPADIHQLLDTQENESDRKDAQISALKRQKLVGCWNAQGLLQICLVLLYQNLCLDIITDYIAGSQVLGTICCSLGTWLGCNTQ